MKPNHHPGIHQFPMPALLLLAALGGATGRAIASEPAAVGAPEGVTQTESDLIAIPAPRVDMKGRILRKDGITPVMGATLVMKGVADGESRRAVSRSGGRFEIHVLPGEYRMSIVRGAEIFESDATFRVPAGEGPELDLLLLHHIEPTAQDGLPEKHNGRPARKPATPSTQSIFRGPDPRPGEPKVVGTIVDIPHVAATGRPRWLSYRLGLAASILAVVLAAD